MSEDTISQLYYSQNNLENTFKQVSNEIMKRTNKDISKNSAYRTTFNKMASITYDKCPQNERNLSTINSQLVDKSVGYFHTKIFEKESNKGKMNVNTNNINNSNNTNTTNNNVSSLTNTDTSHGFTMVKENENIDNKYNELLAQRSNNNGGGNPNTYLPQPSISSSHYNNSNGNGNSNETIMNDFKHNTNQPQSKNDKACTDFTVKPFNLSDDMTDTLFNTENVDSPLYQNIENLQKMEGSNPMAMLEDYQKQRNQQVQSQSENYERNKNQNNTQRINNQQNNHYTNDISPNPINQPTNGNQIVLSKNNTNATTNISQTVVDPMDLSNLGNEYTQTMLKKIDKNMVNDNKSQPASNVDLAKMQEALVKLQKDTQPDYIEKVHYINVNSVDRQWEENAESRFKFRVKFNQHNEFTGAGISQMYKNVVSVELVNAILPMDSSIVPFDTRLYNGLMKYPYLLLRIDELDSVFRGTNNWVDRAFSTLIFDKVFFSSVLSTEYISGAGTSIVNSTPKQGFTSEYNRGFMKFNPAYFEKKKFYNNPLASLNSMSISITDPRGNFINTQTDVLTNTAITFTGTLDTIGATLELGASNAYPFSTHSNHKMIKIETTTYFSNRLFRVGDRILVKNFTMNTSGTNNSRFQTFINREEGHTIINLDLETNGLADTNNRGFIKNLYISPPGTLNTLNQTVDGDTNYYTNLDFTSATYGTLINIDLQSHLLFRIVTRDPDTSNTLKPINIY